MNNKIIITGATGLIGKKIIDALFGRGYDITVLTRSVKKAKKIVPLISNIVYCDYNPQKMKELFEDKYAVIHLAGENIMSKRWSAEHKKNIFDSRINTTRNVVQAVSMAERKPAIFISASAVGYYGNTEEEVTESSKPGNDFLADLVLNWENEAQKVEWEGVRFVAVRIGIVLDPEGGALQKLVLPFKLFLGGTPGSGRQWVPWIHMKDLIRVFEYSIDNKIINGPVNAASPNPVRMKDFTKEIGKSLRRPSLFKIPAFALRIILGESSSVILNGAKVIPKKLHDHGFKFEFPELEPALKDLLG